MAIRDVRIVITIILTIEMFRFSNKVKHLLIVSSSEYIKAS